MKTLAIIFATYLVLLFVRFLLSRRDIIKKVVIVKSPGASQWHLVLVAANQEKVAHTETYDSFDMAEKTGKKLASQLIVPLQKRP